MSETTTARLENTIRGWLSEGRYSSGDRLPSERQLADELGAGRTTVRLVLTKLVAEGLLTVDQGRGYYVSDNKQSPIGDSTSGEPWKIHGERLVYDNPWVQVALVDVEPPGVDRFEHHVVRLQRVAITAVLDERDRVLMLRRYRFVPDRWGWELPGGIVDAGEDPERTAIREVEEETGWRPASVQRILTFQPMVGMVDSPHEIFIGREARLVGTPTDIEEAGQVEWIPLREVPKLMGRNELLGAGTYVALLHILAFGDRRYH